MLFFLYSWCYHIRPSVQLHREILQLVICVLSVGNHFCYEFGDNVPIEKPKLQRR